MKNKKIIIISVCIVLLIAIVTAVILLLPKDKKTDEEKPNEPQQIVEVVVTFDTDGGESIESIKVEKGKTITLPTTTKDGFNFLGWYNGEVLVKGDEVYDSDTTLKAKWEEVKVEQVEEKKTFTVSFNTNGGNKVSSIKVECGKTLGTLPTPKKDGYTFVSWADKNGKVILKGAKLSCENVTLYANWEKSENPEQLPPPNQNIEPEPVPSKTYTCPDGYKLEGTKCTITTSAKEKCGERGFDYSGKCVTLTANARKEGQRGCPDKFITYMSYAANTKGEMVYAGTYFCYYYKVSAANESACTSLSGQYGNFVWRNSNSSCYVLRENASMTCDNLNGYVYIGNPNDYQGVNGLNGGCFPLSEKQKYCDSGYTLSGNNCIKTIDATLK